MKPKLLSVLLVGALLCAGCAATEEPLTPLAGIKTEVSLENITTPETVREYANESDYSLQRDSLVSLFFGEEPPTMSENPTSYSYYSPDSVPETESKSLILGKSRSNPEKLSGSLSFVANWASEINSTLFSFWGNIQNQSIINAIDTSDRLDETNAWWVDADAWIEKLRLSDMEPVYGGFLSAETQCQLALLNGTCANPSDFHSEDGWLFVYGSRSDGGYAQLIYTKDGLYGIDFFSYGELDPVETYAPVSVRQAMEPVAQKYNNEPGATLVAIQSGHYPDEKTDRRIPVWTFVVRTEITRPEKPDEPGYIFHTEYVKMKDGEPLQLSHGTDSMTISVAQYQAAYHALMSGEASK